MTHPPIVISVGGSLIVPDGIDVDFLKNFKRHILEHLEKGMCFVIIAGGGKTARRYQEAAHAVTPLTPEDLDWIGIHATRLNGHLLRAIFCDMAYPILITNEKKLADVIPSAKIIIAAGWKPGHSTDFVAVEIAKHLGAHKLINLSNIDHVFTADPRTDKNAQPIQDIAWSDFRKLIPETWDPGLSSPFDPVASKEAELAHMEVAIINGNNLVEFDHFIEGNPFMGTHIH